MKPHPQHNYLPWLAARRPGRCLVSLLPGLFGLLISADVWAQNPNPGPAIAPFRIGFSATTFSEINENDGKAAVKVWAQALARERGIPADPQPLILKGAQEIGTALTNRLIDAINLTTEEYWTLKGHTLLDQCVVGVQVNSIHDEYLLLVHRESGIARLQDLRGRSLAILQSPRASLAPAWLESLLLQEGLGVLTNFWGRLTFAPKPTKVVLPVFFHQLDACVVTRKGFDTMAELNPQTGLQLKALAASPPLVPFVFGFSTDYHSPIRSQILAEIRKWHTTPAGRQILTLFQCDSLEERPATCLDSALELLSTRRRLREQINRIPALKGSLAGPGREAGGS